MSDLVLVQMDDWTGLYVDGKLLDQNHSLGEGTIVEAAGGEVHWREYDPDDFPGFPETLDEWREWDSNLDKPDSNHGSLMARFS